MPCSSLAGVAGPVVRRRPLRPALVLAASVIALFSSGCSAPGPIDSGPTGSGPTASGTAAGTASDQAVAAGRSGSGTSTAPDTPAGSSMIATARGAHVTVRTAPGSGGRRDMANPTAIGAPLTFRVLQERAGWLRVQLPIRPNGSSGWVERTDVTLSTTTYRLVISMKAHRLDVMHDGERIARHPVGVGKVSTPTPKGTYYLTELIQPPNPKGAYGPYAFGLSAFSETLTSFAGGPGQLGLHGTNAPNSLGRRVSHGCLRLSNPVITELAHKLPLGTPVEIRA